MVTCSTYFTGNGLSLFLTDWPGLALPQSVSSEKSWKINSRRPACGSSKPTDAEGSCFWKSWWSISWHPTKTNIGYEGNPCLAGCEKEQLSTLNLEVTRGKPLLCKLWSEAAGKVWNSSWRQFDVRSEHLSESISQGKSFSKFLLVVSFLAKSIGLSKRGPIDQWSIDFTAGPQK